MPKTWIVGLGSFYGHDALGLEIMEPLAKKFNHNKHFYFLKINAPHELLALAATSTEKISSLIIIDALLNEHDSPDFHSPNAPQDIKLYSLEDLQTEKNRSSGHIAGLYESLQLLRMLYYPQLAISIIAVSTSMCTEKHSLKFSLTPALKQDYTALLLEQLTEVINSNN